jgi:hypothetical protein
MLKLWRYTTAHQLLLPIQQLLQRHRSSMAALQPIITVLQDVSSAQQLNVKLQQQLHPQQKQQQQRSWLQLLAEPTEALVQQLHNQLPGVAGKVLLQLLRLLSAAVAGLEATVTPDLLQQILEALDQPGSFQPVMPQQDMQQQQQQAVHSNTSVRAEQEQQQQQQVSLLDVSAMANAAVQLEAINELQQQQQQEPLIHTSAIADAAVELDAIDEQQQQQQQQQQQPAALPLRTKPQPSPEAPVSQQAEDEPYSPTRHAADELTAAAAAAEAAAAAGAGAAVAQRGGTAANQQQQLLGKKRPAEGGELLQQPPSKKAAAAAAGSKPDAGATAASSSPASSAAPASADAAAAPDAAAAAAGNGKYKLPGEAYALTLFDDLRFSLQQLRSAKAVVDTRAGRLVQLSWYLQVNEPLRQRLPSQELALKFLAKFPGEGSFGFVKLGLWLQTGSADDLQDA